jgi:hypothetical protein
MAVVERAGDVERFGQVAAGGVQVARRQLVAAEGAKQRSYPEQVTGLAEEPQGVGRVADRARMVPLNVRGERPGEKQAAGQCKSPSRAMAIL